MSDEDPQNLNTEHKDIMNAHGMRDLRKKEKDRGANKFDHYKKNIAHCIISLIILTALQDAYI